MDPHAVDVLLALGKGDKVRIESRGLKKARVVTVTSGPTTTEAGATHVYVTGGAVRPGHIAGGALTLRGGDLDYQPSLQQSPMAVSRLVIVNDEAPGLRHGGRGGNPKERPSSILGVQRPPSPSTTEEEWKALSRKNGKPVEQLKEEMRIADAIIEELIEEERLGERLRAYLKHHAGAGGSAGSSAETELVKQKAIVIVKGRPKLTVWGENLLAKENPWRKGDEVLYQGKEIATDGGQQPSGIIEHVPFLTSELHVRPKHWTDVRATSTSGAWKEGRRYTVSASDLAPAGRHENPIPKMTDWKSIERYLLSHGWEVGRGGSGHRRLRSPSGACMLTCATTPSDPRAIKNLVADIRRCERLEAELDAKKLRIKCRATRAYPAMRYGVLVRLAERSSDNRIMRTRVERIIRKFEPSNRRTIDIDHGTFPPLHKKVQVHDGGADLHRITGDGPPLPAPVLDRDEHELVLQEDPVRTNHDARFPVLPRLPPRRGEVRA